MPIALFVQMVAAKYELLGNDTNKWPFFLLGKRVYRRNFGPPVH